MEYLLHLAIIICIYLILGQGFNLVFGLGNMLNLAYLATYSIGAYISALAMTEGGMSGVTAFFLASLGAGLFSLIPGMIAARLTGDYFAIGTLAFGFLVSALLTNWKSLTGGVLGIAGIPRPEIFGISLDSSGAFFFISLCISFVILSFLWNVFSGPFGRRLKAQGEDEKGACVIGLSPFECRCSAFFLSSLCAGIAGALYALYLSYIDPSSFPLSEMIFVLTLTIVGSPGSFWGVCAAVCFLVLLPEPLRFLPLPAAAIGPLRQLLYAVILFLVLVKNRSTLFPQKRIV